jgi:2-aminoadipate transaminase
MVDAIQKHFPDYTSWSTPRGGFYVWVQLPEKADATEILKKGIEKGVVIVTGKTFDPAGVINNCMRISYCNTSIEKINAGIPLVAEAIREVCG